LIREPSERRTWWKDTSFSSVALNSFTGIVTSPKLMLPFQMARTTAPYPFPADRAAGSPTPHE
jgi:hypothetical protein